MAAHKDTDQLVDYKPSTYPSIGNPDRFIANELDKISRSIRSIITVMRLIEARMNDNGLS